MASKCALAARVDSFHESPRGEAGQSEINNKLLCVAGMNIYILCIYTCNIL